MDMVVSVALCFSLLLQDLRNFLQWMKEQGHLNHTALFLIADHGPWMVCWCQAIYLFGQCLTTVKEKVLLDKPLLLDFTGA